MEALHSGPDYRFADWPSDRVPRRAAGVYTVEPTRRTFRRTWLAPELTAALRVPGTVPPSASSPDRTRDL